MKQPKEPSRWRYPRAYIRMKGSVNTLLIIYPDGSCERQISSGFGDAGCEFAKHVAPCWADNYGKPRFFQMGKCESARDAVRKMHAYGLKYAAPAIYLGEVK